MPKALNVFLTTYNANLRARTATVKDLTEWLTTGVKDFSDKNGAGAPPDLVVIGMQEVAELHLALAGATSSVYSLLTLQITSILSTHATSLSSTSTKESYNLLGLTYHTNVALFVFALNRTLPVSQKARGEKGMVLGSMVKRTIGLGFVGGLMGNKAAVGGRIWIERGEGETPVVESFTFICAHFAPHAQNIADRIANYDRLTSRLLFPLHPPSAQTPIPTQINASSHLFLLGDLNYRLGTTPAPGGANLPAPKDLRDLIVAGASIEKEGKLLAGDGGWKQGWETLKKWDTLRMVQVQGRSLGGFEEGDIAGFPPTYKFEIGKAGVYSTKRTPSYTDRILFSSSSSNSTTTSSILSYQTIPTLTLSDHTPVLLFLLLHPCHTSINENALLDVQISPRASDGQIQFEKIAGAVLDTGAGLGWWLLVVLGGGQGEVVGAGVAVVVAVMAWLVLGEPKW